jgi:hypothetical protein
LTVLDENIGTRKAGIARLPTCVQDVIDTNAPEGRFVGAVDHPVEVRKDPSMKEQPLGWSVDDCDDWTNLAP